MNSKTLAVCVKYLYYNTQGYLNPVFFSKIFGTIFFFLSINITQ